MKKATKLFSAALAVLAAGLICSCEFDLPDLPDGKVTVTVKGVVTDVISVTLDPDEVYNEFPKDEFTFYTDFEKRTEWDGKTSVSALTAVFYEQAVSDCKYHLYWDGVCIDGANNLDYITDSYDTAYLYTDSALTTKYSETVEASDFYIDLNKYFKNCQENDEYFTVEQRRRVMEYWVIAHMIPSGKTYIGASYPDWESLHAVFGGWVNLNPYAYHLYDVYNDADCKTKASESDKELWLKRNTKVMICEGEYETPSTTELSSIEDKTKYYLMDYSDKDKKWVKVTWDGDITDGVLHSDYCGCLKKYAAE